MSTRGQPRRRRWLAFLTNLKKQVHECMEESKAEMRAAGFETTNSMGQPGRPAVLAPPASRGPQCDMPARVVDLGSFLQFPTRRWYKGNY